MCLRRNKGFRIREKRRLVIGGDAIAAAQLSAHRLSRALAVVNAFATAA